MTAPVPRIDISSLGIGADLGNGGQGRVTAVSGPLIGGQPAALKAYSQAAVNTLDAGVLETIADFPRRLSPRDRGWLQENAAWPAMVVEDHGTVCGFLMRTVPQPYYFGFWTQTQGPQWKLADVAFLLNPDDYVRRAGLTVTAKDRLELLGRVAASLSQLHALGAVIGDFSPKNLLFSLRPSPSCFFIDCDAVRLHGATVLKQVETPDWEAPPGEPRATIATDSYKLGLLAIRMFARDQSSGDASALATVSPELGRLARLSQDPSPARRPAPGSWTSALKAAASSASAASATRNAPRAAGAPISASVPIVSAPVTRLPPRAPRQRVARRSAARKPVIALSCIIAVAAIVALVIHDSSAGSGAGAGSAAATASSTAQAASVNAILNRSAATRRLVETAVNDVGGCSDVAGGAGKLASVVGQRTSELRQASALTTGALPSGATLKADLTDALHASLRADRDFLSWAREIESRGCTYPAPETDAYKAGLAVSAEANSAKEGFIQIWNPIASSDGFQTRSPGDI
jgi:hypothetical protein